MIDYLLQIILFQLLFLAVYDLLLAKETFFNHNRVYLIATPILAFILPLIKIPTFQKTSSQEVFITIPEVFISPQAVIEKTEIYNSINYISIIFYAGVFMFSVLFIAKLTNVLLLIVKNKTIENNKYKLILLPESTSAFSFFNYIFLGAKIPKEQQAEIIQHEIIHCKQKHSIDLLVFELLRIVMWFNPLIYLFQKRITLLHEYISDTKALSKKSQEDYINTLLSGVFQVREFSFTNQFHKQSLLKKRIIMMTKRKSKNLNQLKYLLLVPVLASILFYTSCGVKKTSQLAKTITEDVNKIDEIQPVRVAYINGTDVKKFKGKSLEEVLNTNIRPYIKVSEKLSIKRHKTTKDKDTMDVMVIVENNKPKKFVYKKGEPVPFKELSQAPFFFDSSCERGDKKCFSTDVSTFVNENFDLSTTKNLGLTPGKMRVFVMFTIAENGNITTIKSRAPHPDITKEAERVVKSIPKLNPGVYKDKKVTTRYALPISFTIE